MKIQRVQKLRGPNVWANFPVLEAWVELEELADKPSDVLPGFNDRLMSWLPSMIEHRCGIGERGGFFQRLRTGTYMGHILEHVTLELQSLAGTPVGFGRARETSVEGTYKVAIEYFDETLGLACLDAAFQMLQAAIHDTPYDVHAEIERLRDVAHRSCFGPSTGSIVAGAVERQIPFLRLDGESLVQLGYGARQRRINAAETDGASAIAESIAQDKQLTRELLQAVGVPIPEGRPVRDADDAWRTAEELGVPVVVKPQFGNHGRGVAVNLTARDQILAAYANAAAEDADNDVIVEHSAVGDDYRLLVVGDKMVAAARREPAHVIGNGRATINELIEEVNRDPRRSDGHATVLSKMWIDGNAAAVLAEQGLSVDSVPAEGVKVLIRRNANLSTGGTATDVTDLVHPDFAQYAVDAARMVGLDIAGVDCVARDITAPMKEQRAVFVEVNAQPGLRMHLQPSVGTSRAVGRAIVDMLFPGDQSGRIPIVAVTGVNGKTTVTRLISHIQTPSSKCIGMTCTDGIYVGGRRIDADDCSGPQSARRLLMNPRVDMAVLETARGGILREGLGFDRCDVAVVTNIGEGDHLGLADVNTLEQLAKVKRCIVDVVAPTGAAVLNADDPLVAEMAPKCPGAVVYFTRHAERAATLRERTANQRVAFARDGAIVLAEGASEVAVAMQQDVPLTHGGRIPFQVENVLAAAAACWALGTPLEQIRHGLQTFSAQLDGSPARFNVMTIGGATVIVDYGHNTSSLTAVLEAMQLFPHRVRSAVYSTAGDRRDCDIVRQGKMLGDAFDRVILYEDQYIRGRASGDIIRVIREGLAGGLRATDVRDGRGWADAVSEALKLAKPGELVLMQADTIDEAVELIQRLSIEGAVAVSTVAMAIAAHSSPAIAV